MVTKIFRSRQHAGLRMGLALLLLYAGLVLILTAVPAVGGQGRILEELRYQVDVWLWSDAMKTRVTLEELAPGRYRAEVAGQSQGFVATLSGNWQGNFATEMIYKDGKFLPLVYRENSTARGKRWLSEYRFDHEHNKMELYKLSKNKGLVKKWETTFKDPPYDPLTFYYNQRLAPEGLGQGGETLKYSGIPYPKQDDIVVRIGPMSAEGRKIMVELANRIFEGERSQIYAFLDKEGVPTKAWTRVMAFGTVNAQLLPGGKRLNKAELTRALETAPAALAAQNLNR
uniref:DUF3108 domain-containing protein n=1 Tax=Desulfobacca acetoxidans TaxID=60893 RepID=A0A7V4G6Y3_9BACT